MENQGRFLLFLVISTLILVVYSYFFSPTPQKSSSAPIRTTQQAITTATASGHADHVDKKAVAEPDISVTPQIMTSGISQSVTIETDLYIAVFSNHGAVLTGFGLKSKKYVNRQTLKPIQLIHTDPTQPKPFTTSCASLPGLSELFYEVVGSSKKLSAPNDKCQVSFRVQATNGAIVEKTYRFTNDSYVLGFDISVKNTGRRELPSSSLLIEWAPTLGQEEFTNTQSQAIGMRVAIYANGHILSEKTKKSNESVEIPAPVTWAALANQFFVAALIPDPASGAAAVKVARDFNAYRPATKQNPEPVLDPKSFAPRPILSFAVPALSRGERYSRSGSVFFGPQEFELMKNLNIQLERVVDFGMFGFISIYMLKLLKGFFSLFHNWGLAIILLSILVKLVLWWPTHSSYIQMSQTQRKMKELQPQMDALKKKYANDRQRLNQETMALYQKTGINPTAGCLPMFLQIPVFFALYATLGHTVELRGAPFILWIKDLSLSDPSHVLPLLMGATMIVQQRVSGQMSTSTTPGQQKFMMWFFPVFLTAISFQWPSGLLLYWVVTNLLSILQQQTVNRHLKKTRA